MKLNRSFITFILVTFVYHYQAIALPSPQNDPDSEPSDINAIDSEENGDQVKFDFMMTCLKNKKNIV